MRVLMIATRRERTGGATAQQQRAAVERPRNATASRARAPPATPQVNVRSTTRAGHSTQKKQTTANDSARQKEGDTRDEPHPRPPNPKRTLHLGGAAIPLMPPHPPYAACNRRPVRVASGTRVDGQRREHRRRDEPAAALCQGDAEDVVQAQRRRRRAAGAAAAGARGGGATSATGEEAEEDAWRAVAGG